MEEMKVPSENAIPLDQEIMQGVKEIEPWAIFEQTAWEYAKTMVEEEVRCGWIDSHIGASKALSKVVYQA